MRLSRFHIDLPLKSGESLTVEGETAHYLGRVLRLKPGMSCQLFNGRDGEFAATIIAVGKHQVELALGEGVSHCSDSKLTVHLGLGLSRGERMDYAVQKAVELGVSSITPLFTEHCEVKLQGERINNRLQHWQGIAVNACEQCGRISIPEIFAPLNLNQWLTANPGGIVFDQTGASGLDKVDACQSLAVLIGPEGGLSDTELQTAVAQQYQKVRLGPRILRTETAPVAALAILQYLYGDLGI